VVASGLVLLGFGEIAAYSVLLGGLLSVIPNLFFSWRAFRGLDSLTPGKATTSLFAGEAGKFLLTVSGFALVFVWVKPLWPEGLFLAFGVTLISIVAANYLAVKKS